MASELFERVKVEGWATVGRWVADKEPETHHLEFKRKTDPATATLDPGDCEEIAKSLSAFANTGGGVLVLGVDAGAGQNRGGGFDRVRRAAPIADVEAFGGALERRLRTFTDPPIAALAVHAVTQPTDKSGIVLIDVPASGGGPHRATNATTAVNDRYYMRTAAGAQTMPHPLLADRFGRIALPRLRMHVRQGPVAPFGFVFSFTNEGRGAARRPAAILREVRLEAGGGELRWPSSPAQDASTGFVLRALPYGEAHLEGWFVEPYTDTVVYPGAPRGFFALSTSLYLKPENFRTPIRLDYRAELYALDVRPVVGRGWFVYSSLTREPESVFEVTSD